MSHRSFFYGAITAIALTGGHAWGQSEASDPVAQPSPNLSGSALGRSLLDVPSGWGFSPLLSGQLTPLQQRPNELSSRLTSILSLPVAPGLLLGPPALQELLAGVGPTLGCSLDIQCLIDTTVGAELSSVLAGGCSIVLPTGLDINFGEVPASRPAIDWAKETSVVVECPQGIRYRVLMQSMGATDVADFSSTEALVGATHKARMELRSGSTPLAEREFISTGGLQLVPVTALLLDRQGSDVTPVAAGKVKLTRAPQLVLQVLP